MRSERVDALRASIYPLTATFTPQPPLIRPLEATTPPDLALEGLGALAKMTSVTEITAHGCVSWARTSRTCISCVHPIGVHLTSMHLMRVSHRRVLYGRVPHGRVSHGRAFQLAMRSTAAR
jgi:hypothetical protein